MLGFYHRFFKAAYYLLKKLKFDVIGENKNRKYITPAKLLD